MDAPFEYRELDVADAGGIPLNLEPISFGRKFVNPKARITASVHSPHNMKKKSVESEYTSPAIMKKRK
jgi:hypothetical protein